MHSLSLTLLGNFQAHIDEQQINGFRTSKVQAMLIYLVAEPQQHTRDKLIELLWPGMPERSARHNLRQVLYYLRRAIPELDSRLEGEKTAVPLLLTNRHTIKLNPEADVTADGGQFKAYFDKTQDHDHYEIVSCPVCKNDLEEAVALYQGEFLADFYLEDSNEFEDWAQVSRQAYRRKALDALEILTTVATRENNYPAARTLAERQLEIDNLRESGYRQLMEILALSGHREEALGIYEACRRLLAEELSMQPAGRTTDVYEKILAGDLSFDKPQTYGVRGYELKEEIGAGAYGAVHRATQPAIGREVAAKVIHPRLADDPEFIRRFEDEAQIIARLEHPYIVPLYDYWRDAHGAYLIMRYLKGGSLLSTLLKQGHMNMEAAGQMLNQIASALTYAHQMGIIHRDIKPANILLDESGNAYLSDFGIAKKLESDRRLTAVGGILGTPDYISPEQILGEQVGSQSDLYSLGAVLFEMLTGEKPYGDSSVANLIYKHINEPFPFVSASRPDLPARIDDVIQKATAKRADDRYSDALEMANAFRTVQQGNGVVLDIPQTMPAVVDLYNPYKGLRSFQEADADDFFGREVLVDRLVARLLAEGTSAGNGRNGEGGRFIAVVGPSGSGKSSVIKAGLIPALRAGAIPGSENWFVAEMVPGTHPLEELEIALWPVAVDAPPSLVEPMKRDVRGMLRTIRRILPDEDEPGGITQLLLVIDQFEELFTLVDDEERRTFFLDSLLAAISAPRSPLRLLITLRADFFDRPLQYQSFGKLLKNNAEIVLPMNSEELTWAIREPARRVGVGLEEGLAEAVIADVTDQPGGLPLLQYTLTELFERRGKNQMLLESYQEIGGVRGALGRRAEEIYAGLDPAGQKTTRQLFLRLVTLGEGVGDTRRRVLRLELEGITVGQPSPVSNQLSIDNTATAAGSQSTASDVIRKFGVARLLTFDHDAETRSPTVEVAHEALLREWKRLRSWLAESREDVRLQRLLARAAIEWQEAEKDDSYLLRGTRLAQFEGWAATSSVAMTAGEQGFLTISIANREARRADEVSRQERELETARRLAETEKARATAESERAEEQAGAAQRFRLLAVVLAGFVVVALALALFAERSSREASQNANLAATREYEAMANADLAAKRETEAMANAELAATREAEAEASSELAAAAAEAEAEAAAEALQLKTLAEQERLEAEQQALVSQSRELAAASANNLNSDPELSVLLAVQALNIVRTSEAEQALHTAFLGSRVRQRLTGHDQPIERVAYSPDGSLIALAAAGEELATIWDAPNGQKLYEIPAAGCCWGLYFDADGKRLALVEPGDLFSLAIWDMDTGTKSERFPLPIDTSDVVFYFLSPDWTQTAVAQADSTVTVWDIREGQQLFDLPGHSGLVEVEFSQDGSRLVTYDDNGLIIAWDAGSGEALRQIDTGQRITDHVVSADGGQVAVSASSGGPQVVQIWDLNEPASAVEPAPLITLTGHDNIVNVLAFSPDGRLIASASRDGTSRIWDISTEEELLVLPHGARVRSVAFHPDGDRLLTSDYSGVARIWDISPQGTAEKMTIAAHNFGLNSATLGPDEDVLATASFDGSAKIWNLANGELMQRLDEHDELVMSIAFHPEDQRVATASTDGAARVWDAATGEMLLTLDGHGDGIVGGFFSGVLSVAYSPDGSRLATAGADATVRIWNSENGEELQRLEGHPEGFTSVAFSPDGRYLSTGSDQPDAAIRIWDIETGDELFAISGAHGDRVWGLDFSPDGRFLATAGSDTTAKLWDLADGMDGADLLATFNSHSDTVLTARFSPDGRMLATATGQEVRLWDVDGLDSLVNAPVSELLVLPGGPGLVFSQDGHELITGGADGLLRIYLLDNDELLALAQSRLTRWLTESECGHYLHSDICPASPLEG